MDKTIHTDVVVIGGGPAGYSAAFRCSDLGMSTIIVEQFGSLGGTCLNIGCIPSKYLLHLSKMIKETREFSKYKILDFQNPEINIDGISSWKKKIISKLSCGLNSIAKKREVKLVRGIARFIDKHSLKISNNSNFDKIIFNYAIIATGSLPVKIPVLSSLKDSRIWDSTDALKLNCIPNKLLIIGAGIIGLEMATIYSSLGSNIDIIDSSEELLYLLDHDIVNIFKNSIKNNFNICLKTKVIDVISKENRFLVTTQDNFGISKQNIYDNILVSIGRYPNLEIINSCSLNITKNSFGFIQVDNQLRTNVSNIFAIGDVVGQPMLAHKGMYEANIAAEVISGKNHIFDPRVIPCIIYSDPEIAWTGYTEKTAKQFGINYHSSSIPWIFSGKAVTENCSDFGLTKLLINKDNNKIIGGSIIGRNAGEMLSQISLSIEMGCDVEDIALTIFPHPTLSESINLSAKLYLGTATDILI